MMSFFEYVAEQRRELPLSATRERCGNGQYIVTGANTGLGLETAKHLAGAGAARIIIACRNTTAGAKAKAEIEAATGAHGVLEVWPLDLANYESVKSFAKKAAESMDRIDGLIENAGVALDQWKVTEGHESTLTVNVLSTILLAVLMLPKMSESAKKFGNVPHVVIVSSEVGFWVKPEFDKIKADPYKLMDDKALADISKRYPLSKLLEVLLVRQIAALAPVSRTGVVVNCVNPGLCKTNLSRNVSFLARMPIVIMGTLVGRTPEVGSRNIVHAALAGKDSHGCYVGACEIKENQVPGWVTDAEGKKASEHIWNDVAKELETVQPGCVKKIL